MNNNIMNGQEKETMEVQQSPNLMNLLGGIPESLASETHAPENEEEKEIVKQEEKVIPAGQPEEIKKEEEKKEEVKEEPKKEENKQETEETSYIDFAKAELGLEDDEDEEEETVDGIINIAKKAVERAKANAKKEGPTELYEKLPVVKNFVEHLNAGGSVLTFQKQKQIQDFSKVEITAENVELQEQFYRASLSAKGMDEEEIEDSVNLAKDKGVLHDRSIKGKEFLTKQHEAAVLAEIEIEKKERQLEIDKEAEVEKEIKDLLKTGKIAGIAISPEEAKELEKWGFERNEKGMTARDLAYSSMTIEQSLLLDKIVMGGFKGLGIKLPAKSGKSLADLKKNSTTKTVNLQTSNTVGQQLGINNVKDLFNTSN